MTRPPNNFTAHAVMVAHNNPTGDPTPSESDLAFTRQLIDLGHRATTDIDFTERNGLVGCAARVENLRFGDF